MRNKRARQIRRLATAWSKKKGLFVHAKFRRFYRDLKKKYVRGEFHLPKGV